MHTISRNFRRFLLFFFTFGISIYALQYFSFRTDIGVLRSKTSDLPAQWPWRIGFYGHITAGILALLIGPFQFLKNFRNRNLILHRRMGKVYVAAILLGSICAFYAALFATAGIIAQSGFALLAIAWFFTTFRAYRAIRQADLRSHQAWMVRSYACTMAAITLRVWLPLEMAVLHLSFEQAYRLVAWLCWVPNLAVAQWLIAKNKMAL